jgi:hypothetical protein
MHWVITGIIQKKRKGKRISYAKKDDAKDNDKSSGKKNRQKI